VALGSVLTTDGLAPLGGSCLQAGPLMAGYGLMPAIEFAVQLRVQASGHPTMYTR
jgi:hypothetical protein